MGNTARNPTFRYNFTSLKIKSNLQPNKFDSAATVFTYSKQKSPTKVNNFIVMRCGGVRVIIILSGDDGAGIMAATQTRDSQDTHTYWKMSSRYCYYDLIISLPGK